MDEVNRHLTNTLNHTLTKMFHLLFFFLCQITTNQLQGLQHQLEVVFHEFRNRKNNTSIMTLLKQKLFQNYDI